MPFMTTISI